MSLVEKVVGRKQGDQPRSDEKLVASDAQGIAAEQSVSDSLIEAADFSDAALVRAGFRLAEDDVNWQLSKQFRRIKRPIVRFAENHTSLGAENGNVIMVASAVPREGKTFCTLNLALALAREPSLEILLIDADVHRPMLSKAAGLKGAIGVLD
jgi:protein-tyrosine kinase